MDFSRSGSFPIRMRSVLAEPTKDELPPPNPLITKTFRPCQSAVHIGSYPFEYVLIRTLPKFKGFQRLGKKNEVQKRSEKDLILLSSLKDFFSPEALTYVRNEKETREFNFWYYDLGHAISSRNEDLLSEARKTQENDQVVERLQSGSSVDSLCFESRFESGNLSMVSKVSEQEYNLLLQNDVNTSGNTQWFFFKVTGAKQGQRVKFNILNLYKSRSLYLEGMKVSVFSLKNSETNKEGWFRGGQGIRYNTSSIQRPNGKPYFVLSFTYEFLFNEDSVYFAYSVPYTYSDLLSLLNSFEKDSKVSRFLLRVPLCRTIGGNIVYLLTITCPGTREDLRSRPTLFISARIHPGETVSSFIMHGFLKFLTGTSPEAESLRKKYIFKVVPMLNPDGVVNGNYRCSLLGVDLNRRWKKPNAWLHPEVFSYKKLIENTCNKAKVALVGDFHGHSIKHNIFVYGCNHDQSPHICKAFPFLLSRFSDFFSFEDCNFSMHPSKSRTLRVVLFKELGIDNVFTVEASFLGSDFGKYKDYQMNCKMFKAFGAEFCRSLIRLEDCLEVPRNLRDFRQVLMKKVKKKEEDQERRTDNQKDLQQLQGVKSDRFSDLKEFINNEKLLKTGDSCTSGSNSEGSDDNLDDNAFLKNFRRVKKNKASETTQSSKNFTNSRCKNCGKIEYSGHVCIILFKNRTRKAFNKHVFASDGTQESNEKSILPRFNESKSQLKLNESPSRPSIKESSSRVKLSESPSKFRIVESPSKPVLQESSSRTKQILKVRSESSYKSAFDSRILTNGRSRDISPVLESHLYQASSENKIKPNDFHYLDKQIEFKGLKSASNIKGVHLLGIIEGIQCKLQKFSKNRGHVFRRNLNN